MKKQINYKTFYNKNEDGDQLLWNSPSIEYFYYQRKKLMLRILKNLERRKDSLDIIDVGCGGGMDVFALERLSSKKHSFIGVDVDKMVIKRMRKIAERNNLDNIQFSMIDISDLSWGKKLGKKFDFIILSEVIEHLYSEDQDTLIKELESLLKPQGVLLITCPNRNSIIKKFFYKLKKTKFHKLVQKETWRGKKKSSIKAHVGELTFKEIKAKVNKYLRVRRIGGLTSTYGSVFIDESPPVFILWLISTQIIKTFFPFWSFDIYLIATK